MQAEYGDHIFIVQTWSSIDTADNCSRKKRVLNLIGGRVYEEEKNMKLNRRLKNKNIAKGTTDPRVEFILQVLTQILIKFHLKNLEQVSTSKSQPNMNISSKVKSQNIDQT